MSYSAYLYPLQNYETETRLRPVDFIINVYVSFINFIYTTILKYPKSLDTLRVASKSVIVAKKCTNEACKNAAESKALCACVSVEYLYTRRLGR